MTQPPAPLPPRPPLRHIAAAAAVFALMVVVGHFALSHLFSFFHIAPWVEEFLEGAILVAVVGAPLLFVLLRYLQALGAAHRTQVESARGGEAELREVNRRLRILSECNQILVRAGSEEELLTGMCRAVVELGNYRMAWIGFAENDPGKTVRPAASWGDHTGLYRRARISWGPDEWGRGPTGRAIRGRTAIIIPNLKEDPQPGPWSENAHEIGIVSSLAVPLLDERGEPFGAFTIHAGAPDAFQASDAETFRELASDIVFGIRAIREREENRRLARAVEQSGSVVIVTDAAGIIQYVNPAFSRLTGYTLDEIKGQTPRVLKSGEALPEAYEELWRTIASGKEFQAEFLDRKKDGTFYWASTTIAPVVDERGAITHYVGIQEDITALKEAQEGLERHVDRLQSLLRLDRDISAGLGPDEVFGHVVRAAAEIFQISDVTLFLAEEGGDLVLRSSWGEWGKTLSRGRFPAGEGLVGTVVLRGEPVYVRDVTESPHFGNKEAARAYGLRSYLGVPLRMQDQVIGVLSCLNREAREFSKEDIELLALLGNHAAIAIERAELLEKSQKGIEFLRSVLHASPDPVMVADPEDKALFWNRAAEELFGYTAEELNARGGVRAILPEGEQPVAGGAIRQVMGGGRSDHEGYRRRKDGTLLPVRITGSPVRDTGGNVVARTIIFHDLTRQLKVERDREIFIGRLKALNGLISQVSSSLKVDEVLALAARSAAEVLGVPYSVIFLVEDSTLVARADHGGWTKHFGNMRLSLGEGSSGRVAQRGEPLYVRDVLEDPDFLSKEKAREKGIGSYLGVPLKAQGRTIGVMSILSVGVREYTRGEMDLAASLATAAAAAVVNAQAHAQLQDAFKRLQQSQALLVRAEKLSSIGTLTAGAAHEILNPANIIGLHAQRLMWENKEGTTPHESAQVIIRNVERIGRICEDLRRFSRDEASKREPFRMDDALRQSIRPLESELRLTNIEVSYRLAPDAPMVRGDRNQMQQVFFNLLRNAMDAMPEGGTLTVASRGVEEDGEAWWETQVSDTGSGIPPENLPRIFDPFFTTKAEDKGTGLGLSVSFGIVESHNGKIWADNNPDRGVTFYVRLPIREASDEQAASAHSGSG